MKRSSKNAWSGTGNAGQCAGVAFCYVLVMSCLIWRSWACACLARTACPMAAATAIHGTTATSDHPVFACRLNTR